MEEKRICFICGEEIPGINCIWVEGERDYICQDCYDNGDYFTCEECGDVHHIDNMICEHDIVYCEYCYNKSHSRCECCGEMVHNDDLYTTSYDGNVCRDCFYDRYRECAHCGDIVHENDCYYDDYDDCYYCHDCEPNHVINEYGYKPEPIFNGNSDLYMGIELEIDEGGQYDDNAQKIIDICPLVYCKRDGSLDNGFEIVSHPCDLEYHIDNMKWDKVLEKCLYMDYTSHNAGTCGLHIHVSKNALGDDEFDVDKTIANILYFIEVHWDKMLKFSRRTQEQLNRWASRYGREPNEQPVDLLYKAKSDYSRYRAINLQNRSTIEFRLFRGTLKYNTFVATLQFVNLLCECCKELSTADIQEVQWDNILDAVEDRGYTELMQYMNERKIGREDI